MLDINIMKFPVSATQVLNPGITPHIGTEVLIWAWVTLPIVTPDRTVAGMLEIGRRIIS